MSQVGLAQTFGNMEFMGVQYPQVSEYMKTDTRQTSCDFDLGSYSEHDLKSSHP